MIRRILEAFFRHKLLLLLPPILIPAVVTPIVVATAPTVYDSYVAIWVDHPTYLNYQDGSNQWVTPAQVQANHMTELLHTHPFEVDVARRTTTLAPLVGSSAGEARIDDILTHTISIDRPSDHLLIVAVSAPTGLLSYEVATSLVNAYQEKVQADMTDQSGLAVAYYQSHIQESQQTLSKATADLRRYLATQAAAGDANVGLDPTTTTPDMAALLDPKLAQLTTAVQQAQSDLNSAQTNLQAAQRDSAAALQGAQLGFQVLDQAKMPTAPTRSLRKLIVYPIAALVSGLGLSALLLVLFVAADRSARDEADLAPGLRLLGAVPSLTVKRVPKKLRTVATRRAIGAAAGMALPAARGAR
ncbi:MAG: hypothetical protein JO020_06565 [Chloroflexi bacterium]|nr:hypothetical protein [Chloroflexota bacterium]MBV9132145.1 hypothetical protein [Chloroflexota bacterium]MBV9893811.1 hypothetical protein [Chloroflexota bacterium]